MITFKYVHFHEKNEGEDFGFIYTTNVYGAPTTRQTLHCPGSHGDAAENKRDSTSALAEFIIQ